MVDANVTMADSDGAQAVVINTSGVDTSSVYDSLVGPHPEVAALIRWTMSTRSDPSQSRQGGIFARDRFVTPENTFALFDMARDAATHDDIVSGVAESTEALAFSRINVMCEDEDEENIWNQVIFDLDLDSRIREIWRELFICSQVYVVMWWGQKDYKVLGKSPAGVARKRSFTDLVVPTGMTILDPKKVIPIGNLMFNQEQLAYIADRTEVDMLDAAVLDDPQADPVSRQIIVAKYAPPDYERRNLAKQGINADFLYILNPRNCWRHTLTRPQFQRFADVRMASVFELLDLKHQLRQMDRAHLLGASNFILLIKKGSEQHPAKQAELDALSEQVRTVAQIPLLVGDHRLNVEIVTPKTDTTLNSDKYGTLDSRLTTRLYQMFLVHGGSGSARGDDSVKLAKVIARGLESRRFMLRQTIERQMMAPAVAANTQLTSTPRLRFHPTRIELDFDPFLVQLLLDIRDRGDLSRDSMLNEVDFDQEDEAQLRKREKRDFDKVFTPTTSINNPLGKGTATPLPDGGGSDTGGGGPDSSGDPASDPRTGGRRGGGTRNGGGANAQPRRPKT